MYIYIPVNICKYIDRWMYRYVSVCVYLPTYPPPPPFLVCSGANGADEFGVLIVEELVPGTALPQDGKRGWFDPTMRGYFVSHRIASSVNGGGSTVNATQATLAAPAAGGGSAVNGGGDAVNATKATLAASDATPATGGGSAVNGGGTAVNDGGSAVNGGGAAVNDGGSAVNGGGAAVNDGGSAVNGGGAAVNDGGSAVNGGGATVNAAAVPPPLHTASVVGGGAAVNGGGAAVKTATVLGGACRFPPQPLSAAFASLGHSQHAPALPHEARALGASMATAAFSARLDVRRRLHNLP